MHKCLHSHSGKVFPANLRTEQISSQRSSYVCSACCLPQGVKNSDQFPVEVVEAYKCRFSRPGALTGPINYYRAMFSSPIDSLPREKWTISVPTLITWVHNKHTNGPLGVIPRPYIINVLL